MKRFGFVLVILFGAVFGVADASAQANPIRFYADLTSLEEPHMVESNATGRADFTLDRETLRLTWKITFTGLTSAPTAARLHGPQRPGTFGAALYDIAPKGVKSPLEGSQILKDAEVEYLLSGRIYVNIYSAKYKEGELRGQIEKLPPNAVTQ